MIHFKRKLLPLILLLAVVSCHRRQQLILRTPSPPTLYSVAVDDPEEVALLKQELKLDIISVEKGHLIFGNGSPVLLEQLKALGYDNQTLKAEQELKQFALIEQSRLEKEMQEKQITIVKSDKNYTIIYGTIAQLKTLPYKLFKPDADLRPSEVRISVPTKPDIQFVYNIGVDIFSAYADSIGRSGYIIYGAAFDNQVAAMNQRKYTVTIIKRNF